MNNNNNNEEQKQNFQPISQSVKKSRRNQNIQQKYSKSKRNGVFYDLVPLDVSNKYSNMNGATVIKHKELLTAVTGSAFSTGQYKIQPGQSQAFPWLSVISPAFEMYQIIDLKYVFVSSCPATDRGQVFLAIDYDPADIDDITSVQYISQLAGCKMDKVWQNLTLSLDRAKLRQDSRLYIRPGSVPIGSTIQNYDSGTLLYAVQGTTSQVVGNLFVEYTIALFVPCPYESSAISENSIDVKWIPSVATTTTSNFYLAMTDADSINFHTIRQQGGPIILDDTAQFLNVDGSITNNLYSMMVTLVQTTTLAFVQSLAISLGTRGAGSNFLAYDVNTNALITNELPYTLTGGTTTPWVLSIIARVVSNTINQQLELGGVSHVAIPVTSFSAARFFLSPYYYMN